MAAGIILSSLFAAEIVVQIANLVVANHKNGGPYIHTYIYTFIHAYTSGVGRCFDKGGLHQ